MKKYRHLGIEIIVRVLLVALFIWLETVEPFERKILPDVSSSDLLVCLFFLTFDYVVFIYILRICGSIVILINPHMFQCQYCGH